ncbi:MAG: hypothetical protein DDT18_00390 [Actinobacteria bacterium]|nr:hypothetical protein [Actinomycetota bacterium]
MGGLGKEGGFGIVHGLYPFPLLETIAHAQSNSISILEGSPYLNSYYIGGDLDGVARSGKNLATALSGPDTRGGKDH